MFGSYLFMTISEKGLGLVGAELVAEKKSWMAVLVQILMHRIIEKGESIVGKPKLQQPQVFNWSPAQNASSYDIYRQRRRSAAKGVNVDGTPKDFLLGVHEVQYCWRVRKWWLVESQTLY